jgi:hypothetical protein
MTVANALAYCDIARTTYIKRFYCADPERERRVESLID